MAKILVTGASGTIGQHLVNELNARGANFAVMSSSGKAPGGVRSVKGDWNDVASLTSAFTGVDTIFLLFPLVPNKLELARNAAQALKAAQVKHIVRSSGAGADANAAFSLPKLQGEVDAILQATGIPATFLRPSTFMQNFITFQASEVRDGAFHAPHGDAAQSLIDARDIAAVAAAVLVNPVAHAGKAYTLTGGTAISNTQAAAALSEATGHPVRYVDVSLEAAEKAMQGYKLPPAIIDWMLSLHRLTKAGYASGVTGDVQTVLGRAPISFAQFARDHAAAWK